MKSIAGVVIAIMLVLNLAACSTYRYQKGTATEIHPGHTGHEIHD